MRSFKFEIETLSESLWTMLFYKLIVTKQMTVLKKKGIGKEGDRKRSFERKAK